MARANMRQIEAFNAVMKGGSVTKAASELFISQPAVSKLVQAFEEYCGFALFSRTSGRLIATKEARRLHLETEKLVTGVARVQNTARGIRDLERGEVSVVAFAALSLRLLPQQVARFLKGRGNVRLTLMTRNSGSIEDSMLTRAADFGISHLATEHPGLRCIPFGHCSMVCALPAGHRLASREVISLADLADERLISLGHEALARDIVLEAFSRPGVRPDSSISVQMADGACALVSHGLGVSLVTSLATIGWRENEVVFRPLRESVRMPMWLYTSAYEDMSSLAQKLLDTVRNGIEEVEAKFSVS